MVGFLLVSLKSQRTRASLKDGLVEHADWDVFFPRRSSLALFAF